MRALDLRLVRRARPARLLIGADVAFGLATAVLVLVQATLIGRVIARAFTGGTLHSVSGELVLLGLTFVARGALVWAFEMAGRRAASTVLSELRLAVADRRLRAQPAALDGTQGGEVVAAAVQGIDSLTSYFGRYLPQVILACVVPPAVLLWVAVVDVDSALIMLITLPLVPVFMWLIGRYTEQRTRERWHALRLLSTHFLDVVRGLPTLRSFNRSRAQSATMAVVGERYRQATMSTLRVGFLSSAVLELAATLGVALVSVTVGVRLVGGEIGFQAGMTVLVLAPELYLPVRQLGAQFHASADGVAVAERILALLDAPVEVGPGGERLPPSPATAAVRLECVSFAYPSRPAPVLDRIDLELSPGETVALVGESGAGKSTVAALLLLLAEPASGRVTVGGIDLAQCDRQCWRRLVAWVPQRPTIFRGTVADNIRLGAPTAADVDVRKAAKEAGADTFVEALARGYDTVIGDGGRPLSAGQRRRIAIARAFLRDAPLVILDEPTADLDPASEQLVADAVERLRRGRTVLLLAHRPEIVARADRVVLLHRGQAAVLAGNEAA